MSRHHHHHHKPRQSQDFWERRRNGYGMNLYRNKRDGWVGGVCAGLADHFNIEHWVARLIFVGGVVFFNSLAVFAYLAAWFLMVPRPKGPVTQEYQYDESLHQDRPRNMFRYRPKPSERLKTAKARLDEVMGRVERMEKYVTSKRFELDREFSKIQD